MTTIVPSHNNPLAKWFLQKFHTDSNSFPSNGMTNYSGIFTGAEDYLNRFVHPNTTSLGNAKNKDGYLTDHGPNHIGMVMSRAAELASVPNAKPYETFLEPYEVFILLMAIHCHDIGNMYGRHGHEKRILDCIKDVPDFQKLSESEWRIIASIASTHGGTIDGDKDTIGKIIADGTQRFGGKTYRPQLIASILRLADELSDESCRADSFALKQGNIPLESVIYHRYAAALISVFIDKSDRKISLEFELNDNDIEMQHGKGMNETGEIKTVYLLDEIYERTKKTFFEMLYCMKFMRVSEFTPFSSVQVKISAFRKREANPFKTHTYTIKDRGYPTPADVNIAQLCDGFTQLNGSELLKLLKGE